MSLETPILFLVFNRPDHSAKVFESIRLQKPRRLYIAADGPRSDVSSDTQACQETRALAEKVDWNCELKTLFRTENLGCKQAVSSAISWFFEEEESGIILEDDCLPHPSFYSFCSELLSKYERTPEVGIISGNNFQPANREIQDSYYFSKYPHIWGWATWRRTWEKYELQLQSWPSDRKEALRSIETPATRNHFFTAFNRAKSGQINTWDYQLAHSLFKSEALSIIPSTNLVENIGFDSTATHASEHLIPRTDLATADQLTALAHPKNITANQLCDSFSELHIFHKPLSFRRKLLSLISRI